MRIAFLGPSYPWRGGIAQFAQNMAKHLQLNGHDVCMFTYINQYPDLFFPAGSQIIHKKESLSQITFRTLTPYNPLTWYPTIKQINNWDPDVIIVQYWLPFMAPSYGFILKRLTNVKKVFIIHNVESHEKWLFAKALTKYALLSAKLYITLSAISTHSMIKAIPEISRAAIKQLFHPIYEKNVVKRESNGLPLFKILFFGFVKHYKGLDILLESLPLVKKRFPQIKLIIAGDVYGDKKTYFDLVKQLNITENVEMHFQYIHNDDVGGFFSNCDVSVIPYRTATQSGVAQLSFTYEIPVIATRVGGLEEIVINDKNGFLVESENPQALADAIICYYDNDCSKRFKENIKMQNELYSWNNFTNKLLNIIS